MKRHIPNMITCCNLISGCFATIFALYGDARLALGWIIMGAVFDFFDGMTARLLHVSSPIGKELDSLADVVTFGVAPSAILFSQLSVMDYPSAVQQTVFGSSSATWASLIPYAAFIMAAFSALRLAKFNLDERQTMGFIGLPTPANALFWGALIVGSHQWIESLPWGAFILLLLMLLSCWLLVSEVPMFALKFKHWGWSGNEVRYLFLLSCVPLLIFFGITGIAIIIAWYVLLSIITQRKAA
ncbi:MAG: CDP-alcohol phosphatidyltransferase family protein [Prevotella sp.]|nr:CDP-alcohol phosphatidyltransferase family protein [Prevotella sp.]